MISEKIYNLLCDRIKNKYKNIIEDYVVDYEVLKSYIAEMLKSTPEKLKIENDFSYVDLAYLFSLRWGLTALAIGNTEADFSIQVFFELFQGISNTALSIIKLAQDGFDYQASVLIRSLYEMCFTLLAIVIDPIKRDAFRNCSEEKEYIIWKEYFRFPLLQKTVCEYIESLSGENSEEDFLREWIKGAYKKFSSYVHNDFLTLFAYNKSLSTDDSLIPNLWGFESTRIEIICGNISALLWFTELTFDKLQSDRLIDVNKEFFNIQTDNYEYWNVASFIGFLSAEYYLMIPSNE